jgi:hypothetical protein
MAASQEPSESRLAETPWFSLVLLSCCQTYDFSRMLEKFEYIGLFIVD